VSVQCAVGFMSGYGSAVEVEHESVAIVGIDLP
jgi:hypothetical protein